MMKHQSNGCTKTKSKDQRTPRIQVTSTWDEDLKKYLRTSIVSEFFARNIPMIQYWIKIIFHKFQKCPE